MDKGPGRTGNEIEEKITANVVLGNLLAVSDAIPWIERVRILHQKVLHNVKKEDNLEKRVNYDNDWPLGPSETGEKCGENCRNN